MSLESKTNPNKSLHLWDERRMQGVMKLLHDHLGLEQEQANLICMLLGSPKGPMETRYKVVVYPKSKGVVIYSFNPDKPLSYGDPNYFDILEVIRNTDPGCRKDKDNQRYTSKHTPPFTQDH